MTGDDKIRFCGQCEKNVHNLSTLPPDEVTEVLSKLKKEERVCVVMRRRPNGTVIMDNCPVVLRKTRDRIRAVYVAVMLVFFWLLGTNADAQGLVGAPVDPPGYSERTAELDDGLNDLPAYLALLTALAAVIFPFALPKASPDRTKTWHQIALFVVPFVVLAIGTYIWNNPDLLQIGGTR